MQKPTTATRFATLLDTLSGDIDARAYEIVKRLLVVGELQVAAEHLSEMLCEDQIAISEIAHRELVLLLTELAVRPHFVAIIPAPRRIP